MPSILRAMLALLFAAALAASGDAQARTAKARIDRVVSPIATLDDVQLRLQWPAGARTGSLHLQARRLDAQGLGYRFERIDWRCVLRRTGWTEWHCVGPVRTPRGTMQLGIDIRERGLDARLESGRSRIEVSRRSDAPDLTRVDLANIPLAWTRALLAQAWPQAQLTGGNGDARLRVSTDANGIRIAGPLDLRGVSLDTPDGRIAAEGVGASLAMDLQLGETDRVTLSGRITGGEALFGTAYLAMESRDIGIELEAEKPGDCCWRIPRFDWRDSSILTASGALSFNADLGVRDLEARVDSADLSRLRDAYLSGWLGGAGLGDLEMRGAAGGRIAISNGVLRTADLRLQDVHLRDPRGRFAFDSLDGDARFSSTGPVSGELRLAGGSVYGLGFGPARVPLRSEGGVLSIPGAVTIPMLGGALKLDHLAIRPASGGESADVSFGVALDRLDVAQFTKALGWPAFTGELSGRIPNARYRADTLVFDGGFSMQVFGGRVDVSALSMERPFGVAPTLSTDIAIDDLDLASLTGVLGFGSITGKLDGHIAGLRLVDWQPTAFDARLRTDRTRGVRQRISKRAVQDLSSVGDASLATSLQSQLIGLFDDFGYSRIGIACRLADGICDMGGLEPRGDNAFLIVAGSGIPRLTVVGINRRVDWPTLVERLVSVGKGDSRPVVE